MKKVYDICKTPLGSKRYIGIMIIILVMLFAVYKIVNRIIRISKEKINYSAENELSVMALTYNKPDMKGIVEFDYSDNNGLYTIGIDEFEFTTKWTKASNTSIHAYNDPYNIKEIALVKKRDIKSLEQNLNDLSNLKFSSRVRTPNIGDMVIWVNVNDNIAFTKVLDIRDDTRNSDNDYLKFEYYIYNKNNNKALT